MRAILLSLLAIALSAFAATTASAAVQLTGFDKRLCSIDAETSSVLAPGWVQAAPRTDNRPIDFPRDEMKMRGEGVVTLAFVIGADGQVRDVRVEDAVGPPSFRQISIDAVKSWKYQPATLNGKPVESRWGLNIEYVIESRDRNARHTHFLKFYDKGRKLLADGKPREAIEALNKVFGTWTNIYEVAMTSSILAKAYYELKDYPAAQHHAAHATISHARFLNDGMVPPTLRLGMKLAADAGDYRTALCAYIEARDLLPKTEAPGPISRAQADALAREILAKLASNEPLEASATLDPNGNWALPLERPRFVFTGAPANMPFSLNCIAATVNGVAVNGKEHEAPHGAGPCRLSVVGKPGTTFTVRVMH